jgi:hypothetical protein
MAVSLVKTLPSAVQTKMNKVTGNAGLSATDLNDPVQILRRFLAKYPQYTPLFSNCRWGDDGGGNLAFDQIPNAANTSHSATGGWHSALGTSLATLLEMTPTIVVGVVPSLHAVTLS